MNTFKGTPGEWELQDNAFITEDGSYSGTLDIVLLKDEPRRLWIADVKPYGGNGFPGYEQAKANAKLLCASKQMMEALQAFVDWSNKTCEGMHLLNKAEAALSAALD